MVTGDMRVMVHDPRGIRIATAYLEAIEAQDVGALKRIVGPDVKLTHANYPVVTGRGDAIDMIEGYLKIIEGIEFDVKTLVGDHGLVVIEKVNVARAATGPGARIRVATILEFDDDDLITSIRIYADTADLFRQLHATRMPR